MGQANAILRSMCLIGFHFLGQRYRSSGKCGRRIILDGTICAARGRNGVRSTAC